MARSSPAWPFECFNINCYHKFSTERGLRSHLWRSPSCKEYMLGADRPYTLSQETTNVSQWHPGYGIESTCLNPTMSPNAPLYSPYDKVDYDAFLAGDAGNAVLRPLSTSQWQWSASNLWWIFWQNICSCCWHWWIFFFSHYYSNWPDLTWLSNWQPASKHTCVQAKWQEHKQGWESVESSILNWQATNFQTYLCSS